MSRQYGRTGRPRHNDVLTPAEWDVLAYVRDGLTNTQIASARSASVETIRYHLRNIREKLGLHSRAALISWPGRPAHELRPPRALPAWRMREQIPLVAVQDMALSLAFYTGVLGFEVISQYPDPPDQAGWAALGSGAARIMLHAGHHIHDALEMRSGNTITLCLYLDGIDTLHAALSAAGYRPTPIETQPYGARECFVPDPDGNELSLVEFPASQPRYATKPGANP